jgi:hypothetical protein
LWPQHKAARVIHTCPTRFDIDKTFWTGVTKNNKMKFKSIIIFILPFSIGISIQSLWAQSSTPSIQFYPFAAMSYYNMKDCFCRAEPYGEKKYWPSFGASGGIHFVFKKNLVLKMGINSFRHKSFGAGLSNTSDYDILSDVVYETANLAYDVSFGYLSSSKIRIGPEIGISFVNRQIKGSEITRYYFEKTTQNPTIYPYETPDSMYTYKSNYTSKWSGHLLTFGLKVLIPIKHRIVIYFNPRLLLSGNRANWYEDYQHTWLFKSLDLGISYQLNSN